MSWTLVVGGTTWTGCCCIRGGVEGVEGVNWGDGGRGGGDGGDGGGGQVETGTGSFSAVAEGFYFEGWHGMGVKTSWCRSSEVW